MQNVIFDITNNKDLPLLLEIIKKFGYKPQIVSDFDIQMASRRELIKYSNSYRHSNISQSEIDNLIAESRNESYNKKAKNKGNN